MLKIICPKCKEEVTLSDTFFAVYDTLTCENCGTCIDIDGVVPSNERLYRNFKSMLNSLGIEGTVEFVESNQNMPYAEIYIKRLNYMGIKTKGHV